VGHAEGWLPYLWREWITSVDHKRIGIMYTLLAMVMLLRGFTDAIMMRSQQALAFRSDGYLPPEHYDQIFSAHGTLMIFFVAMPFVIGMMNFVVPLQLGCATSRFRPQLGQPLAHRHRRAAGQHLAGGRRVRPHRVAAVPAVVGARLFAGVGVDYYLWALQISGVGTLLTGVNFVTTVLKLHAPA
jgi:cytochrome o ubiquinol oxidase subunit 1